LNLETTVNIVLEPTDVEEISELVSKGLKSKKIKKMIADNILERISEEIADNLDFSKMIDELQDDEDIRDSVTDFMVLCIDNADANTDNMSSTINDRITKIVEDELDIAEILKNSEEFKEIVTERVIEEMLNDRRSGDPEDTESD